MGQTPLTREGLSNEQRARVDALTSRFATLARALQATAGGNFFVRFLRFFRRFRLVSRASKVKVEILNELGVSQKPDTIVDWTSFFPDDNVRQQFDSLVVLTTRRTR